MGPGKDQHQGGGSAVQTPQAIQEHIQQLTTNPTDYLNFFGELVRRGQEAGVTQQQLLDYVSDNWGQSGSARRT